MSAANERHEIFGPPDFTCPTDPEHPTRMNLTHDAFFCRTCDVWLEKACDDAACSYCPGRPEKPSMAPRGVP